MIQFNLLPDVKQQFVKVNRTKRIVILVSVLASVVLLAIFLLLLAFDGLQVKNLHDLNSDIHTYSSELQAKPDLAKILTVQNQLKSLPAIDDQRAVASRLPAFLSQITPTAATISKLDVDYSQNTMEFTGDADTLDTVNTFVDTLKFTTYTTDANNTPTPAFSNVVLSSFGRSDKGATYTIDLDFDPTLFSSDHQVTLTVPTKTTTRSLIEQPNDLFKETSNDTNS